jgi:hypothetical protein
MKLENTKAQMRKGVLEYCILLVLDGEPLYASNIIQSLKEAKMIVVEGTLYPFTYAPEKFRIAGIPVGGIYPGAAP